MCLPIPPCRRIIRIRYYSVVCVRCPVSGTGAGILLRYPAKTSPDKAGLFSADRCHSLGSLLPPPAALPSFPGISPAVRFRAACKKAGAQTGVCFFGAGNRNRTGTDFTPRDFLTTIAFATLLVCGLDHAFTCSRWSVSGLYTFQGYPWLGSALPLSKVSPNLLTFRVVIPDYLLCSLTDSVFVTNGNLDSTSANC